MLKKYWTKAKPEGKKSTQNINWKIHTAVQWENTIFQHCKLNRQGDKIAVEQMSRQKIKTTECKYKENYRLFKQEYIKTLNEKVMKKEIIKELATRKDNSEVISEQVLLWTIKVKALRSQMAMSESLRYIKRV